MQKKFTEQIFDVIVSGVAKYGTAYALSKKAGVSKSNMSRWLSGTPPRAADIEPVMDLLGARIVLPDETLADYDLIPKVTAKAGAGASLETSGETKGLYAFRKDFINLERISAANSVMMDVVGDSMEPLFREGGTLLVDKSDIEVRDGYIYVVTLGDELRVKRVQKTIRGLILRSENPNYADIPVEGPDLETFVVHGRVRWYAVAL